MFMFQTYFTENFKLHSLDSFAVSQILPWWGSKVYLQSVKETFKTRYWPDMDKTLRYPSTSVNRIKVNRIEKCNLIFGLLNLIYLHLISYCQCIPFVLNHCIFFILLYLSLTENATIMYYSEETWQLILIVLIFFVGISPRH